MKILNIYWFLQSVLDNRLLWTDQWNFRYWTLKIAVFFVWTWMLKRALSLKKSSMAWIQGGRIFMEAYGKMKRWHKWRYFSLIFWMFGRKIFRRLENTWTTGKGNGLLLLRKQTLKDMFFYSFSFGNFSVWCLFFQICLLTLSVPALTIRETLVRQCRNVGKSKWICHFREHSNVQNFKGKDSKPRGFSKAMTRYASLEFWIRSFGIQESQ